MVFSTPAGKYRQGKHITYYYYIFQIIPQEEQKRGALHPETSDVALHGFEFATIPFSALWEALSAGQGSSVDPIR